MTLNRIITATGLVCVIIACVVGGTASAPLLVVGMVLLLTPAWRKRFLGSAAGDGSRLASRTTLRRQVRALTGTSRRVVTLVATVAALAVVAAMVAIELRAALGRS